MKKIRVLVTGITMNCAGTEKAFLSFASRLDPGRYDVTLLLAKKEGLFLDLVPEWIRIEEMEKYGEWFLMSRKNALSLIAKTFFKDDRLIFFKLIPYFVRLVLFPSRRSAEATRMWIRLMERVPAPREEYDLCLAFWGDRTMFYTCDKVKAKKKIAWLHFDYRFPPRDDSIYLPYFERCDAVVNVSDAVNDALKEKLPRIADKCVTLENVCDGRTIRALAEKGDTFPDGDFTGTRILSVIRVCEQKGVDLIVPALKAISEKGIDARWYIVGDGEEALVGAMKKEAEEAGIASRLVFLGRTLNPYRYMKDCDVYAQPSRYEGKPITVEEAKRLFKPIVSTDFLSAKEQLENGRLGLIVPISSEGIAEGLVEMLRKKDLRDHFSEVLKKTYENEDGAGERVSAFLRDVCE